MLIGLVLWAQSVAAVHAVDHQWHDSVELCQLIKNAENTKFLLTPNPIVAQLGVQRPLPIGSLYRVALITPIHRPARAPPLAIS